MRTGEIEMARQMRWVVVVLVVGGGGVALVRGLAIGAKTISQPIAFNHAVHVGDASLDCRDCHTDYRRPKE